VFTRKPSLARRFPFFEFAESSIFELEELLPEVVGSNKLPQLQSISSSYNDEYLALE